MERILRKKEEKIGDLEKIGMGICKKLDQFPVRYVIVVLESKLANSMGLA